MSANWKRRKLPNSSPKEDDTEAGAHHRPCAAYSWSILMQEFLNGLEALGRERLVEVVKAHTIRRSTR